MTRLRRLLGQHPRLYGWLALDLVVLVAYGVCRGNRAWMNAFASQVTGPLKEALGRLCYRTEISVMEVLAAALVIGTVLYVLASVVMVVRAARGGRGRRAWGAVLGAVCTGLLIWDGFCLLWGVNYWTDSFQDLSGIYAQPVRQEDLTAVTAEFAQQLSQAAGEVPRDENGLFAVSREEILADSPYVYDTLEQQFPFLTFDDTGVKGMSFSRLMSIIDFTGFYCPYTGEANVNVDSPACLLPSTAAHEMAHQRGIASEQECNFLAILASTTSGNPAYVYSGYLMGFIHLGNALYRVDPETYWTIRDQLPESVEADLAYNNAYWDQFEDSVVQQASNHIYDGMLKAYGDENGIASYGTVVDLLVAYYAA